jgi:anti-sigma-K factor RskA
MEKKDIIDSGLLEISVLGMASSDEMKLISRYAAEDSAIREELEEIEICLEKLARYFALEPGRKIKVEIEEQIFQPDSAVENLSKRFLPGGGRYRTFQYWSMAASIAFLLMAGFAFWGYQNLLSTQEDLSRLKLDYQHLSSENQSLYSDQKKMVSLGEYLSREGAVQVVLSSTSREPRKATLFWNPKTHEVWLIGSNLPRLPSGKQYQMWGIVAGKPVDAGVFDASSSGSMILPMKPMEEPSMFAVTVENQGGSPTPTLNSMLLKAEL